jgi:glycosyltransferase involved in cell wall biosynthesis
MKHYPKISIVTPSFNQGKYIEETILSVIGQHYPNLEYIIIDGGSTDNTVDVIKKYQNYITYWVSEKDKGQSDAINKGFRLATGDILCWLNSDDYYLPGILDYVCKNINIDIPQLVFGNCFHFSEHSSSVFYGSSVQKFHGQVELSLADYIIQPSSFWTRKCWEKVGELNSKMHYAFDWEWFLRAQREQVSFKPLTKYLSAYRFHELHKSGSNSSTRHSEITHIYKLYQGDKTANDFNYIIQNPGKIKHIKRLKRNISKLYLHKFIPMRLWEKLIIKSVLPSISGNSWKEIKPLIDMACMPGIHL